MGLLGRGGPVPRWRARSLEAGFLRLCAAHARAHAGGVVVLVFLASLPPRPPRWIARWACSDEAGLVANSVARGGPPAAAACCAPAHARPQARTHVGGPVVCGLGDGAGCRMHSGGGARARRHGGASRGMGPRAAHAGRGLVCPLLVSGLRSCRASQIPNEDPTPALAGCRTRSGDGARTRRQGDVCRGVGPRATHAGRGLVCPLLVSELRSCRASHPTRIHPRPPASLAVGGMSHAQRRWSASAAAWRHLP